MKPELPAAKWVRPKNYHLTVRFLGERDRPFVEDLSNALEPMIRDIPSWSGRLSEAGFFPAKGSPRVLWIGWSDGGQLKRTARLVDSILQGRLQVAPETAGYHAHLTVARCRGRWPQAAADLWKTSLQVDPGEMMSVDRLTLYRSHLQSSGPLYEVVKEFPMEVRGG